MSGWKCFFTLDIARILMLICQSNWMSQWWPPKQLHGPPSGCLWTCSPKHLLCPLPSDWHNTVRQSYTTEFLFLETIADETAGELPPMERSSYSRLGAWESTAFPLYRERQHDLQELPVSAHGLNAFWGALHSRCWVKDALNLCLSLHVRQNKALLGCFASMDSKYLEMDQKAHIDRHPCGD